MKRIKPPKITVYVGTYCMSPCPNRCKYTHMLPSFILKITSFLYRHGIIDITKKITDLSGTKKCPCHLPYIRSCYTCQHGVLDTVSFDMLCTNERACGANGDCAYHTPIK